jgi:diguanylate cyclase (GGDEF)-like protein/putative nucleotidyltransferase with HDIG domain
MGQLSTSAAVPPEAVHPAGNPAMPFAARVYIALTVLLGCWILAAALLSWQPQNLLRFCVYLACAVAASSLKVVLPGITSTMSVNYLFILIGVMMLDLPETLLVGVSCTLMQCLWRPKRRPKAIHLIFNLPSSATAVACCYGVYHWSGLRHFDSSVPILLFAASMAYFAANTFSIAGIVSLTEHKRPWKVWYEGFFWTAPQYLVGAALAGIIKLCTDQVGWEWSLLVLPTMYLIYSSYRLYLGRLEEEKRHVSQMADLHLRTIEALAVAIEAKDETTHDHLRRVQVYAVEVARELGASEDDLHALRAASLLHDIGKLAVPEYILSKPGRLTPEEFEKIKIHPTVGAEILQRVKFPYAVVPIVEAHHEKWDGSGYPKGLKGEAIPFGARVLAAVDCLDALASDRQYRRALPLEEAMEFIVAQSGVSYDPRVVDVLKRRYLELEDLARNAAVPEIKLSTAIRQTRGAAPAAGFEAARSGDRSTGEAPDFTYAIAAARQEFQMLHEVTSELGNSLSMEGTMSLLGTRLKGVIPHDTIAIYVCKDDRLVPQYVHGKDFQLFSSLEIPFGQGLSGWVAENRKAIVNGNPSVEPGYLNDPAIFSNLNSAISVPLLGVTGVVGVLTLYHAERDAFTKDHLRLLLAISSKAALTIENALRYCEVQKSAVTDELTALPNTRSLFLHLDSEVARCRRTNTPLAVLVADLDGFKSVNDRFGHLTGNKVLKLVAQGLKNACREYDYVARMGGDEFVLILPGMPPGAVAHKIAELCDMTVGAGRECTGDDVLSLSVGEAFFPENGGDTEELLAEADRRMYQMKQSHRSHRIHDLRSETLARLDLESAHIQ